MSKQDVLDQAETLSFPSSVVEYFQGYLGIPAGGFPEPLRTLVLTNKPALPNGKSCFEGRPGAEMPDYDFDAAHKELSTKYGDIDRREVLSHVMYPAVYDEWKSARSSCASCHSLLSAARYFELSQLGDDTYHKYEKHCEYSSERSSTLSVSMYTSSVSREDINGFRPDDAAMHVSIISLKLRYSLDSALCIDGDLSKLPTNKFLQAMEVGDTLSTDLEPGKTLYMEMLGTGEPDNQNERKVNFTLNGESRFVIVEDHTQGTPSAGGQEKADLGNDAHVGAPMPGVVVGVSVEVGQRVNTGEALVTLSAMKMETVVTAVRGGVVKRVATAAGDNLAAGDLLLIIEDEEEE